VHTFRKYDVQVDTSVATPGECAGTILARLEERLRPPGQQAITQSGYEQNLIDRMPDGGTRPGCI
jgi:hypothetical protein